MIPQAVGITLVLLVGSFAIAWYARRYTSTTLEFYLAGRAVGVFANASAISGDYFSAASFLGVAGAVYASGMDGLWIGTGFAAGFIPVLLFFASPLRRFGEYTLPDFLAARFQSRSARLAGVAMVQIIVLFYLAPQMIGAGAIWELLMGRGFAGLSPYASGVLVTVFAMMVYTALGGMRGTTWNQAVQFWILLTAIMLVAVLGLAAGFSYSRALSDLGNRPLVSPERWRVADLLRPDPLTGSIPLDRARQAMSTAYWDQHIAPVLHDPEAEAVVLMPQPDRLRPGQEARFNRPGRQYGPLDQISLILTLVLGTAGLPHVMFRYYTNPSGPVARWTTVWVLVFTSVFYLMAGMVGVLGRAFVPGLLAETGPTLQVATVDGVLLQPDTILPLLAQSLGGPLVFGDVAAGAFAAMFSTIGGLLMASAASWGHDLFEQFLDPGVPERVRVAVGKLAILVMALVAVMIGLLMPHLGLTRAYPAVIALMVTWAFSVAASGFAPVLFTSIWWKGVTLKGALAGMILGGGGAVLFIILHLMQVLGRLPAGLGFPFLGQLTFPTLITAPLALAVIYLVSWLDRRHVPRNIDEIWLRIHGTAGERQARRVRQAAP